MSTPSLVSRLFELIEAAAAVVGEVDLDDVLRRLVIEARSATGARYAALGVIGAHGVLSDFIHEGMDDDVVEEIGSLPQGRGVLGTVVRERTTIVVDDIARHPDSYGFPEGHPPMKSFLGVPVRAGRSVYGNLYLTDKPGGFTDDDVTLIEGLAVIAGSAVTTARLRERLKSMAIVEDRDRIARDLHDSIIQDLFALGLSLQGLSDRVVEDSVSSVLHQAVDRLHTTVETLRRYIYELKASGDLRKDLSQQLHDLVERMGSAYPTAIELSVEGEMADIEPRIAEEVVKLVTEALSNALRHSRATTIEVKVTRDNDGLVLVVADNGIGFDVNNVERGLGLINMGERARRLGGILEIDPADEGGTVVAIRLPGL